MTNQKEIRASRGKSARNQNESIIALWTIEHLDLTPNQVLGAIAVAPVAYLFVAACLVVF